MGEVVAEVALMTVELSESIAGGEDGEWSMWLGRKTEGEEEVAPSLPLSLPLGWSHFCVCSQP